MHEFEKYPELASAFRTSNKETGITSLSASLQREPVPDVSQPSPSPSCIPLVKSGFPEEGDNATRPSLQNGDHNSAVNSPAIGYVSAAQSSSGRSFLQPTDHLVKL